MEAFPVQRVYLAGTLERGRPDINHPIPHLVLDAGWWASSVQQSLKFHCPSQFRAQIDLHQSRALLPVQAHSLPLRLHDFPPSIALSH